MKKISLKNLNLKEVEQLSREQLKSVLGGFTGLTGGTDEGTTTEDDDGDGRQCGRKCTGSCVANGINGTCGKKSTGECMCATATI